jgi:hypothetical protein
MEQDALNRIAEARAAGMDGAVLDALEARARAASPTVDGDAGDLGDRLDEEDLSSITAALEAEYGTDRVPEAAEIPAEPESEQSVNEVFESFKEHVKASVEVGDFQTHYDLGIAYKEMGLSDAALDGFRIASGAPDSTAGVQHAGFVPLGPRGDAEADPVVSRGLNAPGNEVACRPPIRSADRLERPGTSAEPDLLAQILREEPGYPRRRPRRRLRSKLSL